MAWLVRMLFGIQVLCSCIAAPPARGAEPALLSPRCDDAAVEEAADLALRQINAHREEGYVLSLYRIASAQEQPQEITGSVFYLILDVVDTECHVLSKKLWKNCNTRHAHSAVYGQCKAIIYINQARNIAHLNTYECTLQPVTGKQIWPRCPDCPVDVSPNDPKFFEAAARSLAKFNEESEQTHYFSVLNVTRASMQWVVGPAHFVEFLIQETSCSKSEAVDDISMCEPLPPGTAKIGFCKGSVVNSFRDFVSISCEIFSQQDPATEEENQEANQTPGKSTQDQQASPSDDNPFSPHLEKTVGCVKILPPSNEDITFHSPQESQNEHKDRKPAPPKAVGSTDRPDGEKIQVKKPDLTKPVTGPVFLPFPEEPSLSDSCPGEAKRVDFILHPLITGKPSAV